MASNYEIEVMLSSAKNLKNVNWRNGSNRPYVVVWVDPTQKHSTGVAQSGDSNIEWNDKLMIHVPPVKTIDDTTLYIDVVHDSTELNGSTFIIGSTKLQLIEVDIGERVSRTLSLKRPSGRPQGTIDVKVAVKKLSYVAPHGVYDTPAYGVPLAQKRTPPTTGYSATPTVGYIVPTPVQYNAQLKNGLDQVGQGCHGYVQASFRSRNRQSGPANFGSRPVISISHGSGSRPVISISHGSESRPVSHVSGIVNYGPGQVINVITTDRSRINLSLSGDRVATNVEHDLHDRN